MTDRGSEDYVVAMMEDWLSAEFVGDPTAQIQTGEISISGDFPWKADIRMGTPNTVGKRTNKGDFLIECKGDEGNVRKGVGQALTYRYCGYESGLAVYDMTPIEKDYLTSIPLHAFNVTDTGVEFVSPPTKEVKDTTELFTVTSIPNSMVVEIQENLEDWGYDTEWEFVNDSVRRRMDELR